MAMLAGRTALISGGASGIGKAIASLFLDEGARVVIADINANLLAGAVRALMERGPVWSVVGDVTKMSDAATMVNTAIEKSGRLDVLICCAGVPSVSRILELTEAEFDFVLSTNVKGMFTLIKQAVPHMVRQNSGVIITLGSEMGIVAVPESPAYNASKGAVIMLSKSLALDLVRYNIRVNVLCPGVTRTPLLDWERAHSENPEQAALDQENWAPIKRIAEPTEIAQGALFLASDMSSFAIGSCLILDGGQTAR